MSTLPPSTACHAGQLCVELAKYQRVMITYPDSKTGLVSRMHFMNSTIYRFSLLLTGCCLTIAAATAAQIEPATSPLHDDLLQLALKSGERSPGAFFNFATREQMYRFLNRQSPAELSPVERQRRALLLKILADEIPQSPLAFIPQNKTLPRLYPLWSGSVTTDGSDSFLETVNGFSLIWEPVTSVGLKLHFQDATMRGSRTLFNSPAWYPSKSIAWTFANEDDLYFHDELEGGIFYSGKHFSAMLGRDYLRLGHNRQLTTLTGTNTPSVNQLLLHYEVDSFSAHYLLAELHSNLFETTYPETDWGKPHNVPVPKQLAFHRLAWRGKAFEIGLSDLVVFSEQPLRLGYLNPVSFFWSEEHFNSDSDNSLLAIDFNVIQPGWEIWSELLLDDLSISRFFTDHPVSKTAAVLGGRFLLPPGLMLTGSAGFARPFVYTHFYGSDDFRHEGRLLSSLQPNSLNYALSCRYLLTARQRLEATWNYTQQGVGFQQDGVYHNVGSSFDHTTFGGETSFPFLSGRQEFTQRATLSWHLPGAPQLPLLHRQLNWLQISFHLSHFRAALAVDPDGTPRRHRESFNAAWIKIELDHDIH
jgi:hypothetical protein